MITHLHFTNFRGFSNLDLEPLQRVNLIVGRNNAGKTSLLEGVFLAANPTRMPEMPGLLRANGGNPNQRYFRWLVQDKEGINGALLELSGPDSACKILIHGHKNFSVTSGKNWSSVGVPGANVFSAPGTSRLSCRVVSVQSQPLPSLVKLFAQAVKRKGGEERIEKLLRTVDNRIQKVRVEPAEDGNHIVVDIGLSEMLPLSQVGQGIDRLLAIFSELIGEQPQICIIDEVENGIHHSLLEQVWTGLAAVAEAADIQIFATTHSLECIRSAHAAFSKRSAYDFSIIQLFRVEGTVQGRVLDQKHIEAAIEGDIDLR